MQIAYTSIPLSAVQTLYCGSAYYVCFEGADLQNECRYKA